MGWNKCVIAGDLHKYGFRQADTVYSINGICPTIIAYNAGQIGHQINILDEKEDPGKFLKFLSSHGVVLAHENDCVSLTFGFCKTNLPHTPVMIGICKTITTMCDHDIGVIVDE